MPATVAVASGPAYLDEADGACGQDVVHPAPEISRRHVGVETCARAGDVGEFVSMTRQRVGGDVELFCGPGECEGGPIELFLRHLFFVEVPLADDEEVAGRVVACRGVANEKRSRSW